MRLLTALLVTCWSASPVLAQAPARDAPAATGTAVVRGRVTVAGVDRALSRVEVRALCPPLRVNKAVLTDANGRYEIDELPAGRYTVAFSRVALEKLQTVQWTDPEFLERLRSKASTFKVVEGETRTVDLKIASAP